MSLSVIASIYHKETPVYLKAALESISCQTLTPTLFVLVFDGNIGKALENVVNTWLDSYPGEVKLIRKEINQGLAVALNDALKCCNSEYIARVDTDDISLPNRFELQVGFLEKNVDVDVVGSNIAEIDSSNKIINSHVKYPESHAECLTFFRKRDPLAHPATMFRRSYFEKAGFYDESFVGNKNYEDTILWYQGFRNNCKFANIQEVLLHFRRTEEFYSRRGGVTKSFNFFKDRLRIVSELKLGFSGYLFAFLYFILAISPSSIKKIAYNFLR
ncbi:glycosyltransferase [Photobacterium swingsii]|uniref:glycosyltransferase n=1 Tax=Photobacterium swingsii TaxID=680026 RepID=UPI00352D0B4F